ncbi:MAG: SRPBCC family protein [Microthrixaceae bacterium]|nr:SRPBCC family protein [Microthrixaceae bacterium]
MEHRSESTGGIVSVSREIAASPSTVWELVSDLPRMGEWSPEATGGRWKGGASRAFKGARFVGHNRHGWRRWSTLATVVECNPGKSFAFDITAGPVKVARWRYDLEPTEHGCTIAESWEDHRSALFARTTSLLTGVTDRAGQNRRNMTATLDALARAAEAGGDG